MTLFKKKYFKSKQQIETNFFDTGEKKPCLIFFHGGRAHPLSFYSEVLFDLSKKYRIIAPEIPGFTNEHFPPHYLDLQELASFYQELLTKENLNDYFLLGHSLGGNLIPFLTHNNKKVRSFITVNSGALPLGVTKLGLALKISIKNFKHNLEKEGLMAMKEIFQEIKESVKGIRKKNINSFSLNASLYALNKNYPLNYNNIKAPALIVHAKDDNLLSKDQTQSLAQAIPSANFLEVNGSHDWAIYHQKELLQEVMKFFRDK